MKSIGIAEMIAMIDLKRRPTPLRRDIIFLGVADEELGGLHGAKELLDTHPELFANVGYVLNEGGYNETIVDKVTFWGIEVQQKVPLFLRVTMHGWPGHAAAPPDDGGTLARLMDALQAIRAIDTPYRLTPAVERYFHAIGAVRRDERLPLLPRPRHRRVRHRAVQGELLRRRHGARQRRADPGALLRRRRASDARDRARLLRARRMMRRLAAAALVALALGVVAR